MAIQTVEWQQYIDSLAPSLKKLPISERKGLRRQRMMLKNINETLYRYLLGKQVIKKI